MLKVLLGSNNESKINSIKEAFRVIDKNDIMIDSLAVPSHVGSRPLNDDTLLGAQNRNKELYNYCMENSIDFDLLISIEGGYEQIGNSYFLVTYAAILNKDGQEFLGKSQGLQITQKMYEYVKSDKSLNKIIESIINNKENKKKNGITGFLTNGYYFRSFFDSTAVVSALEYMLNQDRYEQMERRLVP